MIIWGKKAGIVYTKYIMVTEKRDENGKPEEFWNRKTMHKQYF